MKKWCCMLLFVSIIVFSAVGSAQDYRMKHLEGFADFLVAVQEDGTVKATGSNEFGQCDTSSWRDVVAVAAGFDHTLGLKADGTVYAAGNNSDGQCNVQDWKDIVMIAACTTKSIGLKSDGTVVYTGWSYEDVSQLKNWHDIVWVGAEWYLCGINKNGDIVGTFPFDVSGFHNAVQVYEEEASVDVLRRDGTIQKINEYHDDYKEIFDWDLDEWRDICELNGCGPYFTALKRDGTVVSASSEPFFEKWKDIVEIEAGFGVKKDGSIIYTEDYVDKFTPEQLADIRTWKVMVDPDTIPTSAVQKAVP